MKNQYFGDVNDYRKYGLLRILTEVTRWPIGVCWLLTANDERTDGEFRDYLESPDRWRRFDPELYDALRRLLVPGTPRSVGHAETWNLLPGAIYHSTLLQDDLSSRRDYFAKAEVSLASCPLLFFDPDNGIEVRSKRVGSKGSSKYLYWEEIERAYSTGRSLVIYQHFARQPRDHYVAELATELSHRLNAPSVDSFRTPHVVFLVVAHPGHDDLLALVRNQAHRCWNGQIKATQHARA